ALARGGKLPAHRLAGNAPRRSTSDEYDTAGTAARSSVRTAARSSVRTAAGSAAGPAVGTAAECGQAGRGAAEEERRWRHLAGPLHRRGGALRGRAGLRHHQLHPEEQRVRRQGEGPEGAGGYGAEARQLAADWANARQVAHTGFLCGRHAEIVHGLEWQSPRG